MSKGKLKKFAEVETFKNVLQPKFDEIFRTEYKLKGQWNNQFFKNNNPITLELGCGKGEYTVGLAKMFPERNFIGFDIKGSRIWKGAKEAIEKDINNAAFVRARIDHINSFFNKDEVEEIWLTFSDPQLKKPLKRLTSSKFLSYYQKIMVDNGIINLKTDSVVLYQYTLALAKHNNLEIEVAIDNIYASDEVDEVLSIRTYYEQSWLEQGLKSHYLRFRLNNQIRLQEPPDED